MKQYRNVRWLKFGIYLFILGLNLPLPAQQIVLDQPVKAGELTLFRALDATDTYYYVPDQVRLATDQAGNPRFSFLRYVENVKSVEQRVEGEGGGIVHAVVRLEVSEDQLSEARRELARSHPNARIEGPIAFRSGKFGLISAFADTEGNLSRQVVGFGNAPILDGNSAAISIQLTRTGAKILWESFQTATPDISFSFEMELGGYRMPHRALIEADFDQIYEHESFGAGMASTVFAGEIKSAFDDLYRDGAIRLTQVGDDEDLDQLISTAYNKISDLMFTPFQGSPQSIEDLAGGEMSLLDRANQILRDNRKEAMEINRQIRKDNMDLFALASASEEVPAPQSSGRNPFQNEDPEASDNPHSTDWKSPAYIYSFDPKEIGIEPQQEVELPDYALIATYEMKKVRQRGVFRIDLNKYSADNLTLRFDENIGNLSSYLENENYFRQVNLDDPLYRQRQVTAFIDGMNASDFGQYINFVDVILKKDHLNGQVTQDEVRIDRNNFSNSGNMFQLLYGWKNDPDMNSWINYDYQLIWNFFGGITVESPVETSRFASISVTPPFRRQIVELVGDPENLKRKNVRAIIANLYYSVGGKEQVKQVSLLPASGNLSRQVEIILPVDQYEYEYELIWRIAGNKTQSSGRESTTESLLFVDEM